jgi:hypothetical protein
MNAKPIPCQYGGGNEYHCDRSPCMICPGPINQRQGVEQAKLRKPAVIKTVINVD